MKLYNFPVMAKRKDKGGTRFNPYRYSKTWIIEQCNSRVLVGLATMGQRPLYHYREIGP